MRSILVVDDKDDVGSYVSLALISFGFSIRFARDGQSALQMIREREPDLIICDVHLTGISGYDLLAMVRRGAATTHIPFILMTGTVSADGFRRAVQAGADDYLVKPFSPDVLVDLALSLLVRRANVEMESAGRVRSMAEPIRPRPETERDADAMAAPA
jgi:CheY-like chemotaxis protein